MAECRTCNDTGTVHESDGALWDSRDCPDCPAPVDRNRLLNEIASLVIQANGGRHVLLSKRYAIAFNVLRVIEEGLGRG